MYGIAIAILLATACWFFQGQRSQIRRNGKRLPRPPGTLPLAGNGIWFLQPRHKLLDWFAEVQPKVGFETFEISVPSLPPAIVVSDPRNVEHILKNNELFIKGDFFRSRSWDLFGNGIINADGELWKIQRKAGLRFFSNSNLKTFINDVLPPQLEDTKLQLDAAYQTETILDMQNVLLELTTSLMGKMAYDMDISPSLPFSLAFDYASGEIGNRFTNPFWKLKEFFLGQRMRRSVASVKSFGRTVVDSAIAKRSSSHSQSPSSTSPPSPNPPPLQQNLIDSLLSHIASPSTVADAAMNFLSAGRDTTAQSLTWTLYLLSRHPHITTRIRAELSTAFPTNPKSLPLNFDTIQPLSLPYILATFSESLRLYPPVPFELKECTSPTIFPDGVSLPAGAVVLWVPWAMGRSTQIWGADACAFRPERWLDVDANGNTILIAKSAFENPVFNAGPRMCLGKRMAELLAVHVLAALLWEFEIEEVREVRFGGVGEGERRSQNSLTLPMEGGLPVRVRRVR